MNYPYSAQSGRPGPAHPNVRHPATAAQPALAGLRAQLAADLKAHLALCEEVMGLTIEENKALAQPAGYQSKDFSRKRKDLLPRLEQSLMALRKWRQDRSLAGLTERVGCSEVKSLIQAVQGLLMKVLLLDRENQQALLRHGLVPARHLPSSPVQQPHFVADAYRRHSRC